MSDSLLSLGQASLAYDSRPVLVDVDLEVARGEVVVIGAPTGAGASALVDVLAGAERATGVLRLLGRELARLRSSSLTRLRRRLGIIPQDLALLPHATAAASVELALEIAGVNRRDRRVRASLALATLDIDGDVTIERLSMASRQRVAWARAWIRTPDLILADHPTSHQDADGSACFVERIAAAAAAGAGAVIVTRDPVLLHAAGAHGWRLYTIHRHRLVDPAAVVTDPIDAAAHVIAEIERPTPVDDAIPNVVPFPVARSAGNRR